MAVFEYKGLTAAGKNVKGVRDADSAKSLRALLRKEGILLTEVVEEAKASAKRRREVDFGQLFSRVSSLDVAMATRQLATLVKSGVPLAEALAALIDQLEQPKLKTVFTAVREKVNEGTSFSDALSAHPSIFEPLYVNMVAAAEASGTMDAVLMRLADFLDAQVKLKNKIVTALAYPAFMFLMSIAVISIMMIVVVPKVSGIFSDFNQTLPWYTRLLIFLSDVMAGWWWLFAILGVLGFIAAQRWKKTPKGVLTWDKLMLSLPIFGKLQLMVAVSRFSRTLSTLLASGVPLLRAMEITGNVLGNSVLVKVVDDARASIREGESIAQPLKRSGRFPPIVTHMIAIGERSGQLEEMLEHVSLAYDQQVDTRVAMMTSLLEPVMIVVMGGVAGGIAFAILMPLLQLNEFIQ